MDSEDDAFDGDYFPDEDYVEAEDEDGDEDEEDIDYEDVAIDAIERAALENPSDDGADSEPDEPDALHTLQQLFQAGNESTSPFLFSAGGNQVTLSDVLRLLRTYRENVAPVGQTNSSYPRTRARQAPPSGAPPPASEPQKAGVELLLGGEFGNLSRKNLRPHGRQAPRNLARALRNRQQSWRSFTKESAASDLVPNSSGTVVAKYRSNAYSGQFSADSSFYYTCCRDFRLHVYDTNAPMHRGAAHKYDGHESKLKLIKTINASADSWTITDSHLSPDNERMIWASVTPTVYMTSTTGADEAQWPISFQDPHGRRDRSAPTRGFGYYSGCNIWSCRFSADGNEIVAGGDGRIFVYDLIGNRRTVKIEAHGDDVNSCCWADSASGNILISASDDSFLKVWDRRSLGSNPKPSGVLIGHTEGITYVSPKGDGRYVISNGKDQTLRLWDLRKMRSNMEYEDVMERSYGIGNFDYRQDFYPSPRYSAHPKDCSIMSYRGHSVLRTLIRCHFSPMETTGQQYIYSGSADGKIHIWSLDGRVVEVLDRTRSLPISYDPSEADPSADLPQRFPSVCVRDVSWHSQEPVMMSAGWDGASRMGGGSSVAKHEWKGLMKRGGQLRSKGLEDFVEKQVAEGAELRRHRLPGAFSAESD